MEDVKFRAGRRLINGKINYIDNRAYLFTPYNKILLDEIKSFDGSKWHGYDDEPVKAWSIPLSTRNKFQLDFLLGGNPYTLYDSYLETPVTHTIIYPEFKHQTELVNHALSTHYCIWAAEMGTGKTLAALIVMIESGIKDWWWFGPKSALYAITLDIKKWRRWAEENNVPKYKYPIMPKVGTYNKLVKIMKEWDNSKAPQGVVFDEGSRLKTPTAQRTQAAMALADGIRSDWGNNGYVIQMTGTPAPKAPTDWWSQCEIACPGFLKEGNINKLRNRLAIIEQRENPIVGGSYPFLVSWRSDSAICDICGKKKEDHSIINNDGSPNPDAHVFKPCENEVERLYKRMKGLVEVRFKKDCSDLPDKIYRIIECDVPRQLQQYANSIVKLAPKVVTGLIRLRELSDGFLYDEEKIGNEICSSCNGTGKAKIESLKDGYELLDSGNILELETQKEYTNIDAPDVWIKDLDGICTHCGGTGKVDKFKRVAKEIPSPKETILKDLLEEFEDTGRVVIYAGFEGSLDKIEKICLKQGWSILRADGKGWKASEGTVEEILQAFDNSHIDKDKFFDRFPKLAFIGQPGAAGMGLNLTASPVIIYYSNDFNAESRIQSEDRVHRSGMDTNRSPIIIDIINLESDRKILENLQKKKDLQNMTLGVFSDIMKSTKERLSYAD